MNTPKTKAGELTDSLDKLDQLADELHVVWMALLSDSVEKTGDIVAISECVNGIRNRLSDTIKEMSGGSG